MIAAFLLPYPVRGCRAPFLWVYYRLLAAFEEPLGFITGKDYLEPPEHWRAQGRWELDPRNAGRLGYVEPATETMVRHRYQFLPESLFQSLLASVAGNPVQVFRKLLTERIPAVESALESALLGLGPNEVEMILTWFNCPSLAAVAQARGIRVVHLEIGPLRWPHYRSTAYLDFSGVNGGTEAERRYHASGLGRIADLSLDSLARFFLCGRRDTAAADLFALGVALQVEDDSNLVAFGQGFDNQSLLVYAHLRRPHGGVLVRGHPGSLFVPRADWYQVDDSPDSLAFLDRCEALLTVNSSIGLEALMRGIPVEILGDCPHRFITEAENESERLTRMAFYLFFYLVPMDLIYDAAYLRFRLAAPSEGAILARHLEAYGIGLGNRDLMHAEAAPARLLASVFRH